MANILYQWPALKNITLPFELVYQRAVWGKPDGLGNHYRWLAASPGFSGIGNDLAQNLSFDQENMPQPFPIWLNYPHHHYAISIYPSRAVDIEGNTGFLEKQILEVENKEQAHALLLLALFDELSHFDDTVWWDRQVEFTWLGADAFIELNEEDYLPLTLSEQNVAQKIQNGCQALANELNLDQLTSIYCALLESQPCVIIPDLTSPLSLSALSVLSLVMEPDLLSSFNVMGAWPNKELAIEQIDQQGIPFQLVIAHDTQIDSDVYSQWPVNPSVSLAHLKSYKQARCWAEAILDNNPAWLKQSAITSTSVPLSSSKADTNSPNPMDVAKTQVTNSPALATQDSVDSTIDQSSAEPILAQTPAPIPAQEGISLTLWGPSAAGKTLLLAQLYLETVAKSADWSIFPTDQSLQFIENMRKVMRLENAFPKATPVGSAEHISYRFQNKALGISALIHLEDRAGRDYEQLQSESRGRLNQAQGLVLLFDPLRDKAELESEFYRTLENLLVVSGRDTEKDPRPIAVCISKSDIYIKQPDDLRRAIESPDEFVRERIEEDLLRPLEHFCANYRLFPVSSVGVKVNFGVVEPVVFYDDALTPRIGQGGEPFNLMAPFAWVLSEIQNQNQ